MTVGYEFMASFRFLTAVTAVALGCCDEDWRKLDSEAFKKAFDLLAPSCNLFDEKLPFMQLKPALDENAKGLDAVTKLSMAVPGDKTAEFWDLLHPEKPSMSIEEATRAAVCVHYYSAGGNGGVDGIKPINGAPGFRFAGLNRAPTECVVLADGRISDPPLIDSILRNLPVSWISSTELPAWADREGKTRQVPGGLWDATWSPNSVVYAWDEAKEQVLKAKKGGIRPDWYREEQGTIKTVKNWVALRDQRDPFYTYTSTKNSKGADSDPKVWRMDFDDTVTQLAVRWHSSRFPNALKSSVERCLSMGDDDSIMFVRHRMTGATSSLLIRRSEALVNLPPEVWIPGEEIAEELPVVCGFIEDVRFALLRAVKAALWQVDQSHSDPGYINDVEAEFWRNARFEFERYCINSERILRPENLEKPSSRDDGIQLLVHINNSAIAAFDSATLPYVGQHFPRISYQRTRLQGTLRWLLNQLAQKVKDDEFDF